MSLITILNNATSVYDDTDPAWRQFILDHKTYLLQQSTLRIITSAYIQRYSYNLQAYLQSVNYPTSAAWIIGILNAIPSNIEFDRSVSQLYIPPFSLIETLYTTYLTTNSAS